MIKNILLIVLTVLISCSNPKIANPENPFLHMKGCFLLYNLQSNKFEKEIGTACKERFPACSSFKLPLAVMAFDSGVLKDENEILKWDGQKRFLEVWNKDQNAKSWIKDSVVWMSQAITPKLGEGTLKRYLKEFHYGNEDISSGITTAWLNSPSDPRGSLAISGYEQVEFMKKLWKDKLPVSRRSMELTRKISYLETSPNGFILSGKTGSNFYDKNRKIQFGWFIAHVSKGNSEYIAVTNLSDLGPIETNLFGGSRAKEITKNMLSILGLW